MKLELSMKPKEWHPLGEHKRLRCNRIEEQQEGLQALMNVELELEANGSSEIIALSSESPDYFSNGFQFIYKSGGIYEAQIEVVLVDY